METLFQRVVERFHEQVRASPSVDYRSRQMSVPSPIEKDTGGSVLGRSIYTPSRGHEGRHLFRCPRLFPLRSLLCDLATYTMHASGSNIPATGVGAL